jgi:chlorobactene glucosyltransferase
MLILIVGALWVGLTVLLFARALCQFQAYRRSALALAPGPPVSASVTVIIPVRNEAANIDSCLEGVTAQAGLAGRFTIIVVDDGSEDETKAVAERRAAADPRIRVVDAGALPEGWAGKPHACWRGAALAAGDWLCFVDADVRLGPEVLAAALVRAEAVRLDLLSLQPRQELGSFWERVIIPAGMLVVACAKRFDAASEAVVNGQFLLVRRKTYFDVGGHAAVRAEISEDRALAARLRRGGFRIGVGAADKLAATRMYRRLGELWEGFSKNGTEILGGSGATLRVAAAALLFGWTAFCAPIVVCDLAATGPDWAKTAGAVLVLIGTALVIGVHCGTARHFRIPAAYGLTFMIGYTLVACLAVDSVLRRARGRVTWKGRTYRPSGTSAKRV